MKKNYVPKTLSEYLNESKSITLKRKYGESPSVIVGTNAPLRNQVLSYVAESGSVSKINLKKFIIGLKEGGASPAAANMFIKRNSKYFITETRGNQTFFKLSNLGKRLTNQFVNTNNLDVSEAIKEANGNFDEEDFSNVDADLNDNGSAEEIGFEDDDMNNNEFGESDDDFPIPNDVDDDSLESRFEELQSKVEELEAKIAELSDDDDELKDDDDELKDDDIENDSDTELKDDDLKDDDDLENDRSDDELKDDDLNEDFDDDDNLDEPKYDFKDKGRPGLHDMDESLTKSREKRIQELINNLKLNEAADEADELKDEDLDKLDLGDEKKEEEEPLDAEDTVTDFSDDAEEVEKVEITEFILTVDDVDIAIDELGKLGVQAERVPIEAPEQEVPMDVEPETETPADTGEKTENDPNVDIDLDSEDVALPQEAKESLRAFYTSVYLNEDEEKPEGEDLGTNDELSLGDQGEEAQELQDVEGEGEEELVEPTTEFEEKKIKVPAAHWDILKTWLEEKGVDVTEMFGGEIEMEEMDPEVAAAEEAPAEEIADDDIDFTGIGDDAKSKKSDDKDKDDKDDKNLMKK